MNVAPQLGWGHSSMARGGIGMVSNRSIQNDSQDYCQLQMLPWSGDHSMNREFQQDMSRSLGSKDQWGSSFDHQR